MAGALFAVLLGVMWIVKCVPRIRTAVIAIGKHRKDLDAARVKAKASLGGVKVRRGEMQAMHKVAGRLFWRAEKTWVG